MGHMVRTTFEAVMSIFTSGAWLVLSRGARPKAVLQYWGRPQQRQWLMPLAGRNAGKPTLAPVNIVR